MGELSGEVPLLDGIIEAHGGRERWAELKRITVTWHFHGLLLEAKGYPGSRLPTITVDPHAPPNAVITNLHGDPSYLWRFSADRVQIEDASGTVLQARDNPRDSFKTHKRYPPTPWDDLHLLYFVGYAMYNYLVTPFIFAEPGLSFETRELDRYREAERGETWRVLEVTYPDSWPTHTKVQQYYFGEHDLLLRRHDYYADVVHSSAAHFSFDHRRCNGFVIPTLRRVVRRVEDENRPLLSAMSSFGLQYTNIELEDKNGNIENKSRMVEVQTDKKAEAKAAPVTTTASAS